MWNVIHSKTLPYPIRRASRAESCPRREEWAACLAGGLRIQPKAGRTVLLHVADDAVGADQSIENRQHVAAVLDHARENIS